MKNILQIATALTFLLMVNVSFATGTGNKPEKQQEQVQQTLQTGQKGEIDQQQMEDGTESYDAEVEAPVKEVEKDSVEDDSVSKYNFIFYFLYKFKYEAEA